MPGSPPIIRSRMFDGARGSLAMMVLSRSLIRATRSSISERGCCTRTGAISGSDRDSSVRGREPMRRFVGCWPSIRRRRRSSPSSRSAAVSAREPTWCALWRRPTRRRICNDSTIGCGSPLRSFRSPGSSTAGWSRCGSRAGARTFSATSTTRRSDPGLRAEARDRETCRRDRGNQHSVRIPLAVEALRVHERGFTREPVDLL